MIRFRVKRALLLLALLVFLGICLFLDTTPVRLSRLLGPIAAEILATFRDPGTQWMVYACCAFYFVTFLILQKRGARSAERGLSRHSGSGPVDWLSPDLWLCALLLWATARYAFDYGSASRNTHALALIAGAAIGKGVGLWAAVWNRPGALAVPGSKSSKEQAARLRNPKSEAGQAEFASMLVSVLALLLAAAALWRPEAGTVFHYRGQERWQGPWDNPNIYGLLMGVGVVLGVGRICWRRGMGGGRWKIGDGRWKMGNRGWKIGDGGWGNVRKLHSAGSDGLHTGLGRQTWTVLRGLRVGVLLLATPLCGLGLLKSYSRGAWVGVAVALSYLLWCRVRSTRHGIAGAHSPHPVATGVSVRNSEASARLPGRAAPGLLTSCPSCSSWFRRNALPLGILLGSLFILSFWHFRHTEQPLVRRVFTVGNPNDFSWRNRVAAWEGALAMMAENPVGGVGWSRPEALYDHYYRPVAVDERMAIQLNHYLILGTAAGLPAMVCFVAYLGLCFTRNGTAQSTATHATATAVRDRRGPKGPVPDPGRERIEESQLEIAHRISELTLVCRAGAIVLLVGIWFDGGLFNLSTAAPLWILLEVGRTGAGAFRSEEAPPGHQDRPGTTHCAAASKGFETRRATSGPRSPTARGQPTDHQTLSAEWRAPGFIARSAVVTGLLALMSGLLWAHARDPFRRVSFTVNPVGAPKAEAMAVLPRSGGPFPVVVWARASAGDLTRDGDALRQIAEQGLAAVAFDRNETNQAWFNAQMNSVLDSLKAMEWAQPGATGWIAAGFGAQQTLAFLIGYPERAPRVLVQLNGPGRMDPAGVPGADVQGAPRQFATANLREPSRDARPSRPPAPTAPSRPGPIRLARATDVWLIHGEKDEFFPLAEVSRLSKDLESAGASVGLSVIRGRRHSFGPDQPVLIRAAAEFCADRLEPTERFPVNVRPSRWWLWLPVLAAGLGTSIAAWRRCRPARAGRASRWLLITSSVTGVVALFDTACHVALPMAPARTTTAALAGRTVVPAGLKESFGWLAARTSDFPKDPQRSAATPTIGVLLEHAELATLQRELIDWTVEDPVWREWVLSPRIQGAEEDMRWRRMLWESLHPRVRRESNPSDVADIVARHLALRLSVNDEVASGDTLRSMWRQGAADQAGFERLYVAGLRAVGVPARLDADGRAAFHDGREWKAAPRPLSESLRPGSEETLSPFP